MSRSDTVLTNIHPALRPTWHAVARADDVGDSPVAVELLGEHWVLWRDGEGFVAFPDRCPHRRAPLSLGTVEAGRLRCAYHGWCFDPSGSAVEIPALGPGATLPGKARLEPAGGVAEAYGMVWLAVERPLTPLPDFGEDVLGLERIDLPILESRASAGLLADNFLDIAHFPFVHTGTFGAEEEKEVAPFDVARDGWGFDCTYTHAFANREDPGVAAGLRPLIQTRRMTYRYRAPFSLTLRLEYLDAGATNLIAFFVLPLDADRCRIFSTLWRDDVAGDPERRRVVSDFEVAVIGEDLALQSRYHDLGLPLDGTAEVHTRADRSTLELRRILSDLVAGYGS